MDSIRTGASQRVFKGSFLKGRKEGSVPDTIKRSKTVVTAVHLFPKE